jgi:RluA family pseudouridine synthase
MVDCAFGYKTRGSNLPFDATMSATISTIVNIAAYKFFRWDRLESRRDELKSLCKRLELLGTVLLSGEGINMFLAGSRESIDAYLAHIRSMPELVDLPVKESLTDYQPFNRMLVKIKREIIPVGIEGIEPEAEASPKISPAQLKQWLDEKRPVAMLDTRNDYELGVGTFENAIDLNLKTFRQFPKAAAALPPEIKENPVVMFCTGGIRCEKIGPYMKGLGFKEIYQLEGGILKYFEDCQQAHYKGDCFVFDQRVAVDPTLDPSDNSECFACKHVLTPADLESEKYVPSKSCPYCYKTREEQRLLRLAQRQNQILTVASEQRGSTPYENRRWISIPQRCAGMTLLEALCEFHPGYSQQQWLTAIANDEIRAPVAVKESLETKAVSPDQKVREGERFLQFMPGYVEPPIDPNIQLIYEDEAIVVVNKSAPLPMHPSGRFNRNTLESILGEVYYPQKLRCAHRLDSNTTGLVVVARKFAHAQVLQNQFNAGTVEKVYLATIVGHPTWDAIDCHESISQEPLRNGGRRIDAENGSPCLTRFQVLERRADGTSLVQAIPETGRTHQIRLHLASLGFVIQNDPLYLPGGGSREQPDPELQSVAMGLHAWKLAFDHPATKERLSFCTSQTDA